MVHMVIHTCTPPSFTPLLGSPLWVHSLCTPVQLRFSTFHQLRSELNYSFDFVTKVVTTSSSFKAFSSSSDTSSRFKASTSSVVRHKLKVQSFFDRQTQAQGSNINTTGNRNQTFDLAPLRLSLLLMTPR